ncbi:formate dehydrogenase accessory sulfurtransferase FdhD [Aquirhabdus parva]|uniref:formate dehydrogenase accessory sulfurtransferase FdhD n=1 Tax=Aquirhabdus parva TaxID=2283318 RepID=UPI001D17DF24|nr:formate dehydrogenase accessory sulfurtransferase FdhD [Aquirhabdus parva]
MLAVHRFKNGEFTRVLDHVVRETPVALVYNGISHAVMMTTPTDLDVFAMGFSLSEGIIPDLKALYSLDIQQTELGVQIDMTIASSAFAALKEHRRMMVGRTGCGLCGIESLQQFHTALPRVTTEAKADWLNQIPDAVSKLETQQEITKVTGGAHAAAWVVGGNIVALFEDVGRHNALDKLLGYLAQQQLDVSAGFIVMTSRASYELIRKCAQLNIALLASISAPTTMAIRMAKQAGLTLASFCRGSSFVVYTDYPDVF